MLLVVVPKDGVSLDPAAGEMSIILTPFSWGVKKVFTGVLESESQTTSIESGPLSAVTIQRLSSEHAVHVI